MTYERSSMVYDAIYEAMKDYQAEVELLRQLIEQNGVSGGRLLDVACGTGLHLEHLASWYLTTGLDISPDQLAIAQQRLPHVSLYQADMTNFDLGQQFDVATCLFSAVGHLTTVEQLRKAITCMSRHLRPGGLLIVEPWLHPGDFIPGRIGFNAVNQPGLKVCRITLTAQEGNIAKLEMHHLVSRSEGVEYFVEHHELAMYTIEEYLEAFRAAGLDVWHDEQGLMGRGLFIGRKMGPGTGLSIDSPFLTGAMNLYDPLPDYEV